MKGKGFRFDWQKHGRFAIILALHGVALLWISSIVNQAPEQEAKPFSMRFLTEEPKPTEKPKPLPEAPKPSPLKPRLQQAPPLMTAAAPVAAAPVFSVAPQPTPVPPTPAAPAAPPAPLVEARFDADYLHNPSPGYPAISRRLAEQGQVVLKVQVRADGTAEAVEVVSSSGHPRLDQAAKDAVQRWRFVPARRGDQAVPASVRVPLLFRLEE